jgi:alkaline phosphatase D
MGRGRQLASRGSGMTRRELLVGLGFGMGGAVVLNGCVVPAPGPTPPVPPPGAPDPGPFPDGVASGDPRPGASTIWTRLASPADGADIGVLWTVAADAAFSSILAGGVAVATAANGHAVTVAVDGLPVDARLHYRFETTGPDAVVSRIGHLRTAPAPGSSPDRLRFASASCQQITGSWFNAHTAMAAEPDLDFVLHLGDYVYVDDTATQTLADYRGVYRRWRAQPLLRDLHAAVPMVAMWDDGEFVNGVDRTLAPARAAAAKQAWFESFPLLDPGGRRTYRSLSWGDLAEVPVLDVRSYRDPAVDSIDYTGPTEADDPSRTTLGAEQYQWFTSLLGASTAAWRLVGNPYNINPWRLVNTEFLRPFRPDQPANAGVYAPNEAWDDYRAERHDLLRFLLDAGVGPTVFCSGHTHIWLASELRPDPDDPGSPVAAFDVVAGSLTADPDVRDAYLGDLPRDLAEEVLRLAERWVIAQNPGMRYMNLIDQGYALVDVTPEDVTITARLVDTRDPAAGATDGARFRIRHGSSQLEVLPASGARGSFA